MIDKEYHILPVCVRKCARCRLKLSRKLSARKVRHNNCTQNTCTKYGTKHISLDDTIPKICWIILSCNQFLVFWKPLRHQLEIRKKILYHSCWNIYNHYSKHAESLIYMRSEKQERQCIHWEHAEFGNLSRIPLDFCKRNDQLFME